MRDDSDEKPCISFLAREVQSAAKPAEAREEEKPFGPISTAATEGRRTRPWPFPPRAEQAISFRGSVGEKTFGMANGEEPVEKALMASSSVAVTSEDSANSNLATLMAPAEPLSGELREPLSGRASTPLSGGASTPLSEGAPMPYSGGASTPLSGGASTPLSGGASTPLSGREPTPLSGGAPTLSGVGASPEIARPTPALVPATANGGRYTQQQDLSAQRRRAACCREADGRGYPSEGSMPQQKQQQRRRRQHQQ